MSARVVDDMEDIIDPLLMRKRSGKYIAQTLVENGYGAPEARVPVTREELIQKVRAGWPDHGSTFYPVKNGYITVPPVRDGGATARLIDFAVDTVLAALRERSAARFTPRPENFTGPGYDAHPGHDHEDCCK